MLTVNLSDKHRAFCEEYIIDFHVARACERLGFTTQNGYQILNTPEAQEYIQFLQSEKLARNKITADRVLQEIARIAFADPRKLVQVDSDGKMQITATDELSPDDAAAIAGIERTKSGVRIKVNSKLDALQLLGRHLALFTDVQDQRVTFTQMPEVKIGAPGSAEPMQALTFEVGNEPNKPKVIDQ